MEPVEIVIRRTGQPDRSARFGEGTVRVGRGDDNEVVLSDVGVSRRHAQIRVTRAEIVVQDLGSGNGCYHDGKKFDSLVVNHGDEVVIDPFVLEFRLKKAAATPALPAPVRSGARLDLLAGAGTVGSSYPISSRGLTIGRSEDRDVVIPDPAASRHHCSVLPQAGEYLLRDMGSANGVFVGPNRVRDHVLQPGEVLRIGNTEMRFVRGGTNAESTTQFGQNAGNSGSALATQTPVAVRAPPKPGGFRPLLIAGIAVIVLLFVGFLAFSALGILAVAAYVWSGVVAWPAQQGPIWVVELPPGLPSTPTPELFDVGVGKMQAGDNEGALLDFYRVLTVDPENAAAEKFAFAAGEYLILQALERPLGAGSKERHAREAERDRLLSAAKRGDREATARLLKGWRDDPVASAALSWRPSPAAEALSLSARRAATLQKKQSYAAAAAAWTQVIQASPDPAVRDGAEAGRLACRRELARGIAVAWADAIRAEAFGQPDALQRLSGVAEAWPDNPSTALRLNPG